mmetsp:Transcript_11307/g.12947  ORF Transcript_11307/g.12947 Transcript_11307/m.12947 type:complete len:147 (+) Transcript_11307:51-491(+)|eukprot:CAMPEP_0194175732 /NCGR_PEP_ID=MMETSP0154-20130528/9722_1 /TAXON_ID=1049557 /ORGANISM="Thalassiothrix antarctica, Strain L6-D1" /LENGTH=146 /DNA_ID=CAMNT_0038889639 /DNA_START=44 /DNA_END=484 /DNA_ORIENTATION=-
MKMLLANSTSLAFLLALVIYHFDVVSSNVLCPGQPSENYCDCDGDCTGQSQWCTCPEAQKCCKGATPTVLCPNEPVENYCDCAGDCTRQSQWCACPKAQKCCNGDTPVDLLDNALEDELHLEVKLLDLEETVLDLGLDLEYNGQHV